MAKSIPCVWFRHITATSFGPRSSRGQVDSQDGYRCEESIGREIFREDMGSPGGYAQTSQVSAAPTVQCRLGCAVRVLDSQLGWCMTVPLRTPCALRETYADAVRQIQLGVTQIRL